MYLLLDSRNGINPIRKTREAVIAVRIGGGCSCCRAAQVQGYPRQRSPTARLHGARDGVGPQGKGRANRYIPTHGDHAVARP